MGELRCNKTSAGCRKLRSETAKKNPEDFYIFRIGERLVINRERLISYSSFKRRFIP